MNVIPIEKPTDAAILAVLEGFLSGRYTRDDVYGWQNDMRNHFAKSYPGCISILAQSKIGNFIVQSLAFIKDTGVVSYEDPTAFFIRNEDIKEYIAQLNCVDCTDKNGKIERFRHHQFSPWQVQDYPLVCLDGMDGERLRRFNIFFERGIVDDLAEPVEFAFVKYGDAQFYFHHTHGHSNDLCPGKYQFTIYGLLDSVSALVSMLLELDICYQDITFESELLGGASELWRLDDNNNEFLVAVYETQLEAEFAKQTLAKTGFKQSYFVIDPQH